MIEMKWRLGWYEIERSLILSGCLGWQQPSMVLINSYRMDDESDHFVVISNMIRSSEMVFGGGAVRWIGLVSWLLSEFRVCCQMGRLEGLIGQHAWHDVWWSKHWHLVDINWESCWPFSWCYENGVCLENKNYYFYIICLLLFFRFTLQSWVKKN